MIVSESFDSATKPNKCIADQQPSCYYLQRRIDMIGDIILALPIVWLIVMCIYMGYNLWKLLKK